MKFRYDFTYMPPAPSLKVWFAGHGGCGVAHTKSRFRGSEVLCYLCISGCAGPTSRHGNARITQKVVFVDIVN